MVGEWSGGYSGPATGRTDWKGNFDIPTPQMNLQRGASFTFTVTDVQLNTAVYDPSLNVQTSDTTVAR